MADELTTDACSGALPPSCVPGTFDLPACYTTDGGVTILEGFNRITRTAACVITASVIVDSVGAPVVGATLVACPGTGGGGGGGGGGILGIAIQDDAVVINPLATCLNFTGAGVTVTNGACVQVAIPGGGAAVFPLLAPSGSCAAPSYSFTSAPDSGMFHDNVQNNVTIGNDNCVSFVRVGAIVRIQAANGDFVQYGASMLTQIAGGTRIELTQAAPIAGRGVVNLFSLIAGGDTQSCLLIGGNATAGFPGGEGWVRGGDSFFAGQAGGAAVLDAGDANNVGSLGGDAIVSAGRGLTGGTPGNIVWRTNALTRSRLLGDGSYEWNGSVGIAGQVLTSAGPGVSPGWGNVPSSFPGYGSPVDTGQANADGVALTVARSDHVHRTLVEIDATGAVVASRPKINFVSSTNVTVNAVDNPGQDRVDVTLSVPAGTFSASAQVVWMCRDLDQANGTRVMAPGFEAQTTADTPKGYSAPRAGTFRNLRARHQTAQGNGTAVTYTLRVNGVATALTVSLATGAVGTAANLVNTVAVVAGDLIEMIRVNPVNLGNGQVMAAVSAEFA